MGHTGLLRHGSGGGVGPLHPHLDLVGVAAISDGDHQLADLFPRPPKRRLSGFGACGQGGLGGSECVGACWVVGEDADVVAGKVDTAMIWARITRTDAS